VKKHTGLLKANDSDNNMAAVMCKNRLSMRLVWNIFGGDLSQLLALPMAATGKLGRKHLPSMMG
tara:strand:- start:66974 stop:67165 length:192 start_codon:yes stop_codon:yes gene_type:complete